MTTVSNLSFLLAMIELIEQERVLVFMENGKLKYLAPEYRDDFPNAKFLDKEKAIALTKEENYFAFDP